MLTHDRFYNDAAKNGLVRQPVEFTVALLVATGLDAEDGAQTWLMDRTGQRLLYPPNVSGWKPNGYWINASAMGARQEMANGLLWRLQRASWEGDDGYMDLGQNSVRITKTEALGLWSDGTYTEPLNREDLLDRLILALQLDVPTDARNEVLGHLEYLDESDDDDVGPWQRLDALFLLLSAPEMHIA